MLVDGCKTKTCTICVFFFVFFLLVFCVLQTRIPLGSGRHLSIVSAAALLSSFDFVVDVS